MSNVQHTPAQEVAIWLSDTVDSHGLWYPNDIIPVVEKAYAPLIDALEKLIELADDDAHSWVISARAVIAKAKGDAV